jgi:predicted nucleic acid-binding protein
MARYFLDSSAFVKRYHRESGSSVVEELFRQSGHQFFISRLALVEFHSAFARRVREGFLTESDFEKLAARVDADLAADVFRIAAISSQ